jgi:hypothetical protein
MSVALKWVSIPDRQTETLAAMKCDCGKEAHTILVRLTDSGVGQDYLDIGGPAVERFLYQLSVWREFRAKYPEPTMTPEEMDQVLAPFYSWPSKLKPLPPSVAS